VYRSTVYNSKFHRICFNLVLLLPKEGNKYKKQISFIFRVDENKNDLLVRSFSSYIGIFSCLVFSQSSLLCQMDVRVFFFDFLGIGKVVSSKVCFYRG